MHVPIIVTASHSHSEAIANYAVRNVLRDIQDWLAQNEWPGENTGMRLDADDLRAYLLTLMVKAGGADGEG